MFSESAAYYDLIYSEKDYPKECELIDGIIQQHCQSGGNQLLDVACGTGQHLFYLRDRYDVEGLDLDAGLLAIARERCPETAFHEADMVDFDLGEQFDAITVLFSAIGYVQTVPRLNQTLKTLSRHTRTGGVLIVEPWIYPNVWIDGHVAAVFVDVPDLKIARMSISDLEGRTSDLEFHYLVATPAGVEHFTERHRIGLFTHEEYLQAFENAGFSVVFVPDLMPLGRGVYIGVKNN